MPFGTAAFWLASPTAASSGARSASPGQPGHRFLDSPDPAQLPPRTDDDYAPQRELRGRFNLAVAARSRVVQGRITNSWRREPQDWMEIYLLGWSGIIRTLVAGFPAYLCLLSFFPISGKRGAFCRDTMRRERVAEREVLSAVRASGVSGAGRSRRLRQWWRPRSRQPSLR